MLSYFVAQAGFAIDERGGLLHRSLMTDPPDRKGRKEDDQNSRYNPNRQAAERREQIPDLKQDKGS